MSDQLNHGADPLFNFYTDQGTISTSLYCLPKTWPVYHPFPLQEDRSCRILKHPTRLSPLADWVIGPVVSILTEIRET